MYHAYYVGKRQRGLYQCEYERTQTRPDPSSLQCRIHLTLLQRDNQTDFIQIPTKTDTMAKPRSASLQIEGPSNPHRGRNDSNQQPEPSPTQPLREGSSMSRGRTRRHTDEYMRPPRDPAAYESSSAEDFVYPDYHGGGYSSRKDAGAQSGPGRYQSRMLADFTLQIPSPANASTRARRRDARELVAPMAREETMTMRVPQTSPREERLQVIQSSNPQYDSDSGCCIVL